MVDTKKPAEITSDTLIHQNGLSDNDVIDVDDEVQVANECDTPPKSTRKLSVSLRGLAIAGIVGAVAIAMGVLSWLYISTSAKLDSQAQAASDSRQAEEYAMEYAVNAAAMDYQDFGAWKVKLVNGTSPELNGKLTEAADSMEQILAPLQWQSTAQPLAAKVRSDTDGIYVVDAFVSVLTKTMQAPEGLLSTATYGITLDSNNNWQITEVGGIDSALGK